MNERTGDDIRRRITNSLRQSQSMIDNTIETGFLALEKLKQQTFTLTDSNGRLNPLAEAGEESIGLQKQILGTINSNKKLFYLCASVFTLLIILVLKYK